MPPVIASVLYVAVAIFLLRRDLRQKQNVTSALWIPTVWVFISGTRFVSQWLDTFGINIGGGAVEEGSPIDAIFFGGMTLLGMNVLLRRRELFVDKRALFVKRGQALEGIQRLSSTSGFTRFRAAEGVVHPRRRRRIAASFECLVASTGGIQRRFLR